MKEDINRKVREKFHYLEYHKKKVKKKKKREKISKARLRLSLVFREEDPVFHLPGIIISVI